MRFLHLFIFIAASGCSLAEEPATNTGEFEVASCITEEMLREANASEEEIRQFKEDEAAADGTAGCD